ncbi:hypothetical protein [Brevundimonas sp.]|uniref:hypothetical protein n=1 Tax=Brevundimonas sp. TaxID=1871086 RepID=UPI002D576ED6|nr:hypothetical protein [Brevundimonas sp.]HYD27181.1 hypothetical protein [Brevundimonas sp.]
MKIFTVRLYAEGATPLRTEQMAAPDAREASALAASRLSQSQTFTCARVYDGESLLSEVGYRLKSPPARTAQDF